MPEFIAMIRGINVSGQKLIKMTELQKMFEDLKFKNVMTYIQSGNVLFDDKNKNTTTFSKKIEKKIQERFGFDVTAIILTGTELKTVIDQNPFLKRKGIDEGKLYITFLSDIPDSTLINKMGEVDYNPEEYVISDNIVYLYVPNGLGKAKLNNNYFESKLKVKGTTRNWNTANILYELSTKQ